jgi:hypothetical protein
MAPKPRPRSITCFAFLLALAVTVAPTVPRATVHAQGDVFPDAPGGFNGMKVGYTVTGALLGAPTDYGSSLRSYSGRLSGSTLTVSGWAEQNSGYGADLTVHLTVGGKDEWYQSGGGNPWRDTFSVSIPIPPGETRGSIGIMMTGSYNAGDRTLFVGADFAPDNPILVPVTGQVYTPLHLVAFKRGFDAAAWSARRAPVAGVPVELVRFDTPPGGGPPLPKSHVVATGATDALGKFSFPAVPVTTSLAISASLTGPDISVVDASASPANYPGAPGPAAPVAIVSRPFDVTGDGPVRVDVTLDPLAGNLLPAGGPIASHLDDFGLLYYHAHQAFDLTAKVGLRLDTHPVPIYGYLPATQGAYWWGPNSAGGNAARPPHIASGADRRANDLDASSGVDSLDRADNREWHEFGHHVQMDALGNLLPEDPAGCSSPPKIGEDCPHLGYFNSSSNDSWKEGFAEFWSLLVNREIAKDGSDAFLYDWGGGVTNIEANMLAWTMRSDSWGSLEEFAVAGLLWDLADPKADEDATVLTTSVAGLPVPTVYADHVEVDLATLWPYLTETSGGAYGYTLYIKELHDRLKAHGVGQTPEGPGGMTALDELFVAHGFFTDTGANRRAYDTGEEIGSSGHLTITHGYRYTDAAGQLQHDSITLDHRRVRNSPPPMPRTIVALDAVDETGRAVTVSRAAVDVRFDPPFDVYDFRYERMLADGRMAVLVADEQYPVRVSISPIGSVAEAPLVLTNDTLWHGVPDPDGVIVAHTFKVRVARTYLPLALRRARVVGDRVVPPPRDPTATRTRTPQVTWPAPTTATPDATNVLPTGTPVVTPASPTATPDVLATAIAATLTARVPTAAASPTPDILATSVAGTLTALAPTPSTTPTPDHVATSVAGTLTAMAPPGTGTATATTPETATSTTTPIPSPSAPAAPCNVVANGDFEGGWTGWQRSGVTALNVGHRDSPRAARLLGADRASAEIWQKVTVPSEVGAVIVTYWWGIASQEPTGDYHRFDTLTSSAAYSADLFEPLEVLSNANTRGYWRPSGYVLKGAAFASSFDLVFAARGDESASTTFLIDDVVVSACPGPSPALPSLSASPESGPPGTRFDIAGSGFGPSEDVIPWLRQADNMWRWDLTPVKADGGGTIGPWVALDATWPTGTYHYGAIGVEGMWPGDAAFDLTAPAPAARDGQRARSTR